MKAPGGMDPLPPAGPDAVATLGAARVMTAGAVATGSAADGRAAATPTARERTAVFLLGFGAFLPLYAPQSVLPQLAEAFGATPAEAGSVIGATTLAVAAAAPLAGPITDRIGRKRAMLGALLLLAPLTVLLTLCSSLEQILAVRFAQGIVLPALFTGAVAYITRRWRETAAATAMGLFVSGSAMGGFAGRFTAGTLADRFGWQPGFAALAALSLVCAAVVHKWLPGDAPETQDGIGAYLRAMRQHLANPRVRAVALFGATVLFSMTGTLSYLGFHLSEPPFSLSAAWIGLVFLVYPVSAWAAPLNGRLLRRFGIRGALLTALGICFAGQMLLLAPLLIAVVTGTGVFIAGIFICQSLALGYVGRVAVARPGAAAGLYVCCFYLGGSLGAVVPGALWPQAGWGGCVALVCGALAAGVLASRFMSERCNAGPAIPDEKTVSLTS